MGFQSADVINPRDQTPSDLDTTDVDLGLDLEFLDDKSLYDGLAKCGLLWTREEMVDWELMEVHPVDGSGRDLEEIQDWKDRIDAACSRLRIETGLPLENLDSGYNTSIESIPTYFDLDNTTDSHGHESSSRDEEMTSSDTGPWSLDLRCFAPSSEPENANCFNKEFLGTRNLLFSETCSRNDEADRNIVSIDYQTHTHSNNTAATTTTQTTTSGPLSSDYKNSRNKERHSTHLWQFLKELLNQPSIYEDCIRWTDRNNGVFRIEDSSKVARLWGERKRRPAMNYDKLSRSIRQYYKKGIIRKTQQSRRLVYQFCPQYI